MTVKDPEELPAERQGATFDRVISPVTRNAFLSNFWGKSFLQIPGQTGKFKSLLSWEDVNSFLEQHRLEPPRLRLVREAKPVGPNRYFAPQDGRLRLKPGSLINRLSEGATLIVDDIHELAPAVREVTEACEEILHAGTVVNLYAGWRAQKGFDLHWDEQDTMILQVSGRKHWKVYRPTRLHPLGKDCEEAPKPTGVPIWDGVLNDGDMLYLPRGWWHVAFPLDEPSLHLTVTIMPADGVDLLHWVAEELKRHAEIRMNVPHLASAAERRQYVSRVRELLIESWTDDILERFMTEHEANMPVRSQIRLPLAPIESQTSLTMETRVRLTANRRLSFRKVSETSVSCHANGIRWECSSDLVPALQCLRSTSSHSVMHLRAQLPCQTPTSKLTIFLTALAMGGAISIEPRKSAQR